MSEPTDTPPKRGFWSPSTIAASVLAAGLLYLLSPLPLLYLLIRLDTMRPSVAAPLAESLLYVLTPIQWLYDNVPAATQFYDWYLGILR